MKTYNVYDNQTNKLLITIKGQKELIKYLDLPTIQYIKQYNIIHNNQVKTKSVKYHHKKSIALKNRLSKYRIIEVQQTSKILKNIVNNPPLLVKIFNFIFSVLRFN